MCRLIEPDGTPGLIVTWSYAVNYCRSHIGWTWEWYTEELSEEKSHASR